jgi:hypothetical protein
MMGRSWVWSHPMLDGSGVKAMPCHDRFLHPILVHSIIWKKENTGSQMGHTKRKNNIKNFFLSFLSLNNFIWLAPWPIYCWFVTEIHLKLHLFSNKHSFRICLRRSRTDRKGKKFHFRFINLSKWSFLWLPWIYKKINLKTAKVSDQTLYDTFRVNSFQSSLYLNFVQIPFCFESFSESQNKTNTVLTRLMTLWLYNCPGVSFNDAFMRIFIQ